MMKTYFSVIPLFFFLSISNSSFCQTIVSGRIVDGTDNEPIAGAQIILQNGNTGVITTIDGFFELKSPKDNDSIFIKFLGYEPQTVAFTSLHHDLGTISLKRSNTTLNEVLVSVAQNNYKKDFKGSNYRVDPVTLQNINPLSTEEVLRTIPGVNIVGDMGISNRPNISIRGSWGRRSKKVLMMEDGTPSAPAPYIAPGTYYNPVSDRIKSIEVYKGADLLRFGPNNMYGGINYITALPSQKPELRVKLSGGQRNYQSALVSYGGTWNNLGMLVEGVYKNFDGFTDNSAVEILNLNAKVFTKLSDNQSFYFKLSGQFEDNQASLSSQTPFTFDTDPLQNPLDADQFTMRRYGVDIIHKWIPKENISFTSKIYASDFERDWWRQVTTKIKASEVQSYVGDQIFNDRYGYLQGMTFGDEDYVIVGKVDTNGHESTTDSRWTYTVSGFKETMNIDWSAFDHKHTLEVSLNLHRETFKDRFLEADSSRWARNGETTTDLWYRLWSANGFVRNIFNLGKTTITPIVRFEHVDMYRQNLLQAANNPNLNDIEEGRESNIYNQLLPGITVDYTLGKSEIYASIYEGMTAPSKVFGFLVVQDGKVTNPLADQSINILPELSWNKEIGWRGNYCNNRISGQLTYFNNLSRNFYAGGRNEIFVQLGKISVQGIESAWGIDLYKHNNQKLRFINNFTFMKSQVVAGQLQDKDLFSQVVHNDATMQEYLDKVNANRTAYEIYVSDGAGGEKILENDIVDASDFSGITKTLVTFGENGVNNAKAPYTPSLNISTGFNYNWKSLSLGITGHYVSEQYAEFFNFENESADGAIGKLPAYYSLDAFVNYDFKIAQKLVLTAFVNGKNITNNIYRASRLNRATSGIFPGGIRQIIFGLNIQI